jgi:hypothetical protein
VASKAGEPERNVNDCATLREGEGVEGADRDSACFSVRQDDSSRNVTGKGAECTGGGDVEAALAAALARAADAGRFDVVAQLARELEVRRVTQADNVVAFDAARSRPRPSFKVRDK